MEIIGITKYLKQNNMKTKLEVGKEYWLDDAKYESGIFVGLDDKTLLFKRGKNCKSCGANETGYLPFADIGREYCEVQEGKQWNFTTPIAMRCTEEQFNGIKDKLDEMGYNTKVVWYLDTCDYLCTNFGGNDKDVNFSSTNIFQPNLFDEFNPALFLALAAMTDKEDGIKGEWWRYTDEMSEPIEAQKYLGEFTVPNKSWRKATVQEIVEHFEKKEFMLPEKWCVKVTVKNSSYLNAFAFTSGYYGLCNFNKYFTSDIVAGVKTGNGYTEITFDQFKKYVLKETPQSCQIIPIPPAKQATIFDDRVEITDWKPKEGEMVYRIYVKLSGEIFYDNSRYDGYDWQIEAFKRGFIKRTESEAKQLVEKLKQAML